MTIARGDLVTLNEPTPGDHQTFAQWAKDPEILALDPPSHILAAFKIFSIEADSKLIGMCCLYNFTQRTVEIGIRIGDKDYWGKGYGTEVVRLLVDYVFRTTKTEVVVAKALANNDRARRCYQKCGFVEYGNAVISGLNYVLTCRERR